MKIGILGAGALGQLYGGFLSKENEVTLIVRRENQRDLINESGILIDSYGEKYNFMTKAVLNGECSEKMDLIIVLVKGYDTDEAMKAVMPMMDENTIVATLQNGMGNHEKILNYADKKNIVVGTSSQGAYMIEDNHVRHAGNGFDHIGVMPGGDVTKAKIVWEVISNSGINAEFNEDIRSFVWSKLFLNSASNCVTALFEAKNYILSENEFIKDIVIKIVTEAVLVANAQGMNFDLDETLDGFFEKIRVFRENKSSMYQDIEMGRPTEIDTINGAIIKAARELKIDVPTNEMMYTLIKAKESI